MGFIVVCLRRGIRLKRAFSFVGTGLITSLIAFLPWESEVIYDLNKHWLPYIFLVLIIGVLRAIQLEPEKFNRRISRADLMTITLTFWYVVAKYKSVPFIVVGIPVTFLVFSHSSNDLRVTPRVRFALGLWSIVLSIFFSGEQLSHGVPHLLKMIQPLSEMKSYFSWIFLEAQLELIFTIGSVAYLFSSLATIFSMLPRGDENRVSDR